MGTAREEVTNNLSEVVVQHRTPWWCQIVLAIFAILAGSEGATLVVAKLFRASAAEARFTGILTLAFGILLLVPHFSRERKRIHSRFSELSQLEQLSLLLALAFVLILSGALGVWVFRI